MVRPVAGTYTEQAPAKVNLHLQVGPRRSDGYHDIVSIFQMVNLCDTITITIEPSEELLITCDAFEGIDRAENTMVHAARLLCAETGLTAAIHIACEKRIPIQAGLGGGSSDGAAVLRLLNRLCEVPLSERELMLLGSIVGSDVPFFLGSSAVAFVHGRGEHVEAFPARDDLHGLIVMPHGSAVSTARAFCELDALRERTQMTPESRDRDELVRMYASSTDRWTFRNDFREVMGNLAPIYDALDEVATTVAPVFFSVSGSGSAYCFISENQQIIELIQSKLELFPHELCLYTIKSLHRGHSGATV